MFIHTRDSAPGRSAKFERQNELFVGKKRKKLLAKSSQTIGGVLLWVLLFPPPVSTG